MRIASTTVLGICLVIMCLFFGRRSLAQDCPQEKKFIAEGDEFVRKGEYKKAQEAYANAVTWAGQCGVRGNPDSSSIKLNQVIEILSTSDSALKQVSADKIKETHRLLRYFDSVSREYAALLLANSSIDQQYIPAKETLALLAYDTLQDTVGHPFNEQIHSALIAIALTETSVRSFMYSTSGNSDDYYANVNNYYRVNGVFPVNGEFTYVLPFYGLKFDGRDDKDDQKIPLLLRAWENSNGNWKAIEKLDKGKRNKIFVLEDSDNVSHLSFALSKNEDVQSVLFDSGQKRWLFTTRRADNVGALYSWAGSMQKLPSLVTAFRMREYLMLMEDSSGDKIGVTNMGRVLHWRRDGQELLSLDSVVETGSFPISAAIYNSKEACLYVGRENGEIIKIDNLGNQRAFFSKEPSRVNALAVSVDGRWLAAGYYSGNVVLWDLSKINPTPDYLIDHAEVVRESTGRWINNSADAYGVGSTRYYYGYRTSLYQQVSALNFDLTCDTLVAATRNGDVYKFALNIDFLAKNIKSIFHCMTKQEWKKYITNVQYIDLCK